MNKHLTEFRLFAFVILLSVSLFSVHIASADSLNPKVYPTNSKPYQIPYSDWIVRWTQWLTSVPKDKSPAIDSDGKNCAINQAGPVWFLAGTFGGSAERTCTVPKGKAIMSAVLSAFCTYLIDNVKTESELVKCAREGNGVADVQASVDGRPVQGLQKYGITSNLSHFVIPADNPFGFPAGKTQTIVDGWFLFMEPLLSGQHTIHFSGSVIDNPTTGTQSYSTEATYHLIVQ
jgi:hypothetical protein